MRGCDSRGARNVMLKIVGLIYATESVQQIFRKVVVLGKVLIGDSKGVYEYV